MKKIYYIAPLAMLLLSLASCTEKDLIVESKTSITSNYLYSTPEGLGRAVAALYAKDRQIVTGGSEGDRFSVLMLDYCTDLMIFRGGTAAGFARLDSPTASTSTFSGIWNHFYSIIGKANEIIHYGEQFIEEEPSVAVSIAEARLFRAKSYFELFKRFERLYLNTKPTTIDNIEGRVFRASSADEIFSLIKEDLDFAMENLDWILPRGGASDQHGRFTKAAAKHIRAQVAMWENDWSTAIQHCEDIMNSGVYGLMPSAIEVFQGADLRSKEVIYAFQMSANQGGGNSVSDGIASGHRISLITTPNYKKISGMKNSSDLGGYGWGRVYPNTYLLSLYDQAKDKRYNELFRHKYHYNDPDNVPVGKNLGDEVIYNKASYLETMHPMCMKYFDSWTNMDNPDRTSSFKDLVVYRVAETAMMACEAYFHRDGGASPKALEFFNKTYVRAGNDAYTGTLTLDMILDEYARELSFEGVRWPLLKRLGLLEERVKLHAGDSMAEDPLLPSNYIQPRSNFNAKWWRWPIPQEVLDVMVGYGQNQDWL